MNAIVTPVHQAAEPELIAHLKTIVGERHVLTETHDTLHYRQGFRFGEGSAVAVVCPGSLLE